MQESRVYSRVFCFVSLSPRGLFALRIGHGLIQFAGRQGRPVDRFLDFGKEAVALHVLLALQHGLHVPVALQQPLGVHRPLLDVLLPAGVDPLEQRLQLRLLLLPELGLLAGEDGRVALLHGLPLALLHLVGNLLDLLRLRVVLLSGHEVLPPAPLQQLAAPLGRPVAHLLLQPLLELQQIHCVPLSHLLDVHLRHAIVLFHVLVPGRVEVVVLHVVSDLHVLALRYLPCADRLLLAFLFLGFEQAQLAVGPTSLKVVPLLLAL
mmetsp:Transcript_49787/g.85611  ORF Transcript_49787/g.85611 Transcript_49787/m.85611 type:complete len:264 (+) Transcript_49787:225-1016(+)